MKSTTKSKKKGSSIRANTQTSSSICNNYITKKNSTLQIACKKVENKLKDKSFRKKLIIASVIFILFNLAIILMLSRKTIAYKLTKYFAKKILEGAEPKEKEIIAQIQNNLPVVVEFVNKHADTIKQASDNYTYYSKIYNDFVTSVTDPGESKDFVMPGGFPSSKAGPKDSMLSLPDKKLDETEAKQMIDDLVTERTPYFLMNLY